MELDFGGHTAAKILVGPAAWEIMKNSDNFEKKLSKNVADLSGIPVFMQHIVPANAVIFLATNGGIIKAFYLT